MIRFAASRGAPMVFRCDAFINAKGFAMTLRNGRELLSIPGPTTVPDEVLNAMHRQAMEIYSGPIVEITMSCLDDLRRMFRTKGRTYIYTANGHGAWEAAAANVLSRGEKVLVMESGRFAAGWGEMAGMMGVEIETLHAGCQRHSRCAQGDGRRRARGAADGRYCRVAGNHAVRDGWMGHRRRGRRVAEGADDAAGIELHRGR
jgi:hypothetical protein